MTTTMETKNYMPVLLYAYAMLKRACGVWLALDDRPAM